MYYVAQTGALVAEGVLTAAQAEIIKNRSRAAMVALSLNSLLVGGILAATVGLVFWLADAALVAVWGGLAVAAGLVILLRGAPLYRLFGNASALIGAGMLAFGAGLKLVELYPDMATAGMLALGAAMAGSGLRVFGRGPAHTRFAGGAVLVMGAALAVVGLYFGAVHFEVSGLPMALLHLAIFVVVVAVGWVLDLRGVTALAIVPFAQVLDTGTFYQHAMYAFMSPEPTLTILQMFALIAGCLWLMRRGDGRVMRQAGVLAIMAFVVANLCFLVGSLWGDVVGEHLWGPDRSGLDYEALVAARDVFAAHAVTIGDGTYAVIWAVLLAAAAVWAARGNRRGLFNTAMTFAAIHAYTQVFESLESEPLAFVICGLSAVPLAWGLWRLNDRFKTPQAA